MGKNSQIPCLNDMAPEALLGKTIFIRVDFNVPMIASDKGYRVLDDTRIRRFLDTTFSKIDDLTDGNCRMIIGSHLGRPHKRKGHEGWDGVFNIQYVCTHFDTLLRELYGDTYSIFPPEITDAQLKNSLEILNRGQLPIGGIKFLPNLRYLLDPSNPDTYREEFIKEVARVSDVFINCAFGCSHRVTKSIKRLPQIMRQEGKLAVAGVLLMEEVNELGIFGAKVKAAPEKTAVVAGGTKIADKIGILKAFVEAQVKLIFVGGRMVNAFLLAQELKEHLGSLSIELIPGKMWQTKSEEDCHDLIREIQFAGEVIQLAADKGVTLSYPDDYKITKDYFETEYLIKKTPDFSQDFQLDLGPETIENYFKSILQEGEIQNVFWNGPLGAYDHPHTTDYSEGSVKLAKILFAAAVADENIQVVIGGGDSAAILNLLDPGELEMLIRKQMLNQVNQKVNRDLLDLQFEAHDTYTLCNYFTSNFFVSTGGGASLEFLESYLKDENDSDISSFLPGTSILMGASAPSSPKAA